MTLSSYPLLVNLGGLGVTCSPWDPRFVGSNPAEVDGFFKDVKIVSTSSPGGTLSWGTEISGSLKNLRPEKIGLWAIFNRHILVLVSKFGEHNRSQEGPSALGSNDHPINTIQYNTIQFVLGRISMVPCDFLNGGVLVLHSPVIHIFIGFS